jgi:hypothetical protein
MNAEFYEIYTEMLGEYPSKLRGFSTMLSPADNQSLPLIEKAVQEACDQSKVVLRPDAKYFLITNFHQMVAIPVTTALGRQVRDPILELIHKDIRLIIAAAAESSKGEKEISGGLILRTVAGNWDKLQTNSQDIWS